MAFFDDMDEATMGSAVVIDTGTFEIRAGIATEKKPTIRQPTVALENLCDDSVERPVTCGKIENWEEITDVWRDIVEEKLKLESAETPLLITHAWDISQKDRERMIEFMAEEFHSPVMYAHSASLFSLFATGRVNGVILDFAFDTTRVIPIREGYVLDRVCHNHPIGGQMVTVQLAQKLFEKDHSFSNFDITTFEDIKKKCATVVLPNVDLSSVKDVDYLLPDGKTLTIPGAQRAVAADDLFLTRDRNDILTRWIFNSISDGEEPSEMFANILLSGSGSQLEGMKQRVEAELAAHINDSEKSEMEHRVLQPPNPDLSAWIGASVFTSLPAFPNACISIAEYEEYGSALAHYRLL